jgi:hypothetical protein
VGTVRNDRPFATRELSDLTVCYSDEFRECGDLTRTGTGQGPEEEILACDKVRKFQEGEASLMPKQNLILVGLLAKAATVRANRGDFGRDRNLSVTANHRCIEILAG